MTFTGNYEHTLDDRGRVAIPARYRESFPGRSAVLVPLPEGCLQVFPQPAFEDMTEEFKALPLTTEEGRELRRHIAGEAFEAELDRQGRIVIPVRQRQELGLDGAVVVVGTSECLEIWPAAAWERRKSRKPANAPSAGQERVD
jgi:MraZ protein